MKEILNLSLIEVRNSLSKGDFSAVELTQEYIDASLDVKELNCYNTFTPEHALKMANLSQEKLNKGEGRLLEGIPIAVKDLFATKGILTTASSKILGNFIPNYESTVTQNLWESGAVLLGKVGCDEFAMGSSNETSSFGNVFNPWSQNKSSKLSPGGSSGGSAAIVSARGSLASIGTDTGGSIRQPSAFCGVTGIKPTYGRCSRWGIVAFASSLDQAGPITRNVSDAAMMLNSMVGYDPKDSTSAKKDKIDFLTYKNNLSLKGLKIGIPKEYQVDSMSNEILSLWERGSSWLKSMGAEIIDVSLPHTKYALPAYYVIAPAEASSNLARYDGVRYGERVSGEDLSDLYSSTRANGFGREVQRRILIGTYVLSAGYYDAYYKKAQKVRNLIVNDFNNVFSNVDLLLTPTTPSSAFELGTQIDPLTMYMNDVFTVPASLAGLPAINIPSQISSLGLPLGLQIIGKSFDELTLLKVASHIEEAAEFNSTPPQMAKG